MVAPLTEIAGNRRLVECQIKRPMGSNCEIKCAGQGDSAETTSVDGSGGSGGSSASSRLEDRALIALSPKVSVPCSRADRQSDLPPRKKPRLSNEQRLNRISAAMCTILECIDDDPDREGLQKTPMRYAKVSEAIAISFRH